MTTSLRAPGRRAGDDWQDDPQRACRDQPSELFFPVEVEPETGEEIEPAYPPPAAKAVCNRCPVRADCLEFALATNQGYGVWGGMSSYERGLISKPKPRVHCPGCGSTTVVRDVPTVEICLACTISWPVIP